jgi:hypothetical protein
MPACWHLLLLNAFALVRHSSLRRMAARLSVRALFMKTKGFTLYDTTLRDGTQGTGISFSVVDKIRVAEKLDAFGIDYIEGGWPGSNPKDIEFFREAAKRKWKHAKITAFGMTRQELGAACGACAARFRGREPAHDPRHGRLFEKARPRGDL